MQTFPCWSGRFREKQGLESENTRSQGKDAEHFDYTECDADADLDDLVQARRVDVYQSGECDVAANTK